jgi:hypothetical protein
MVEPYLHSAISLRHFGAVARYSAESGVCWEDEQDDEVQWGSAGRSPPIRLLAADPLYQFTKFPVNMSAAESLELVTGSASVSRLYSIRISRAPKSSDGENMALRKFNVGMC